MDFNKKRKTVHSEKISKKKINNLEWTGERYLPWMTSGEIHYEHQHRYYFANNFVKKMTVLDLGCGEGYGCALLAKKAKKVVGIDNNTRTINHARRKYKKRNLNFIEGDITKIPIKGKNLFDVITCFEVLEHLEQHDALLSEIKRLIKKSGIFIISTPNTKAFRDNERSTFHKKELTLKQFEKLLKKKFLNVEIFGQKIFLGSNIWSSEKGKSVEDIVIQRTGKEYFPSKRNLGLSKFFIGIASDKKHLKFLNKGSFLVDSKNQLLHKKDDYTTNLSKIIKNKETELENLQEVVKEKDSEIASLYEISNQKDDDLTNQEQLLGQKDQDLESLNKHVSKINQLIKQKDVEIGNLNQFVKDKDAYSEELEKLAAEREKYAKELEIAVKEKSQTVGELEKLDVEREKYAKELEIAVKEKSQTVGELEKLAAEREKYAKELEIAVKEKDLHYLELEKFTKNKQIEIDDLANISKLKEQDVKNLTFEIKNKEYQIIELKNQISEIEKSLSFKLMRKITKKAESSFPNQTKRGELKKIVKNSAIMIERDGISNYFGAVKSKIKNRQFKILEPVNLTEEEQNSIINQVKKNRKNRLRIHSHTEDEIKNDELVVTEERELI